MFVRVVRFTDVTAERAESLVTSIDETELLIFSRRLDEPPTAQGRATRVTPSRRRAGVDTGIDR